MRAEHRRPLVASIIVAIACAVAVGNGFREKAVQQLIEHGVPVMVLAPLAPDVIATAEQGARAFNPQPSRAKAMAALALAGLSTPKPAALAPQVAAVPISTEAVVLADRPASPRTPARQHTARHQAARHHAAAHPTKQHHAQPPVKARKELSGSIQHAATQARHLRGHVKAASARIRHLVDTRHRPSHAHGQHRTSLRSSQHRGAHHSHGHPHGHHRGH